MLEKYFNAGRLHGSAWAGKIWRQVSLVPAGIWIVVLVALLVGIHPVLTLPDRPAHLNETLAECGSAITRLWGLPTADRAGTRIAYAQTTEFGLGILLTDVASGKSQLVHEYKPKGEDPGPFRGDFCMLPWSPDDTSFAYIGSLGAITICDGETGTEKAICAIEGQCSRWPTANSCFTWLSSDSFIYVNSSQEMHLVQRQIDGQWNDTLWFVRPQATDASISFITALSSNRVAWLQGNVLWSLDMAASNQPVKLFEPSTNNLDMGRMENASYSPETGSFLLICREKDNRTYLWQLDPDDSSAKNPRQVVIRDVQDARWINGGKGYAYVIQDLNKRKRTVVIQADSSTAPVSLLSLGDIPAFTSAVNGRRLFIPDTVKNEFTSAIWEYDLDSASLQCVIPDADHHLPLAKNIIPIQGLMALSASSNIMFQLYLPADFDRHQHRRYPVVMGGPYMIDYANVLADCGVIFVRVGYDETPGSPAEERQVDDVYEFCKYLAKMPFVDANRIFLGGISRETRPVSQILQVHPGPWKGAMLLNPSALPDLGALTSGERMPKLLVSAGEAENEAERFKKFQEDAGKLGMRVDVRIQKDEGHTFLTTAAHRARSEIMMNFIFEN